MYYWLFFILEVFYDKNISLKVKSVSEKFSEFKMILSDTSRVFYAIFPVRMYRSFVWNNMVICIFFLLKMSQSPSHSDYIKSGHVLLL